MDMLEEADENLLRSILECPITTAYLALGCLPIRFILMKRILYYNILWQKRDSLMNQFFQAQLRNIVKGDCSITVQEDLQILGIETPTSQLSKLTESTYIKLTWEKNENEALRYLNREKEKHCKVKHTSHTKIEMEDFPSPNLVSIDE